MHNHPRAHQVNSVEYYLGLGSGLGRVESKVEVKLWTTGMISP